MFEAGEIKFSEIKQFLETNPNGVEASSIAGWSAPFKMPNELDNYGQAIGLTRGGTRYSRSSYAFSEFRGMVKASLPVISSNLIINETVSDVQFNFSYQIVASNMSGDNNHPFSYLLANNVDVGFLTVDSSGLVSGLIDISKKTLSNDSLTLYFDVIASNYAGADRKTLTLNVTVDIPNKKPVITIIGENPKYLVAGNTYTDAGATAFDEEDFDITSNITTTNLVNSAVAGTYQVKYDVQDSEGLAADQKIRTVIVAPPPNDRPIITRIGAFAITITEGDTYNDAGATAEDNQDGNITHLIQTVNPVNTSSPGTYTITYDVTDSGGLAAATVERIVVVRPAPNTPPAITLIGDPVVNIGEGTPPTPADIINGLPVGTTIRGEYVMIGPYAASSDITFTKSNTILSQNDGWGRPFSSYASFDIGFTSGTDYNSGHSVIYFRDNNGTLQMKAEGEFMNQNNAGVMASEWRDVSFTSRPGTGQNSGFTIFMEADHMPDHTTSFYAGEWSEGITV